MRMIYKFAIISIMLFSSAFADLQCSGSFVNPITDVCWSCMFPIFIAPLPPIQYQGQTGSIAMANPTIQADPDVFLGGICTCPERLNLLPGILMSFYEPYRSVDITKDAFCLVGLGGIDLADDLGNIVPSPGYGDEETHGMQTKSSFYQMHWYQDPILEMLEVVDLGCTLGMQDNLDLAFMSEVDPAWNDDDMAFIFSPETILFSSLPAQLACSIDCIASSLPYSPATDAATPIPGTNAYIDTPAEPGILTKSYTAQNPDNASSSANPSQFLYWCAGCQGSLFPLDGNNIDNMEEIQTTVLSAEKANMLIHRMGLEPITTGALGMCSNLVPDLMMNKAEWKYSMTFPTAQTFLSMTCCNAFGDTDTTWNSGASYPIQGENFNYLWYHERDCCFL